MSKPSRTEQMILTRVAAAISTGKRVTVDGVSIKSIRFRDDEIEVEWDAEVEDEELQWTTIQPNYLHEFDNGELELKTH